MEQSKIGAVDAVVELLPGWGHTIAQLNALVAERMGLSVRDLDALYALDWLQSATATELGEHVGLTSGSATRMIDRLENAGLVARVRDREDRRRVVIEATASGSERVAAYYRDLTRATREGLSDFTMTELETVRRFLQKSSVDSAAELNRLKSN